MKINTLSLERSRIGGCCSGVLILVVTLLLCLAVDVAAAGKSRDTTKLEWIPVQFIFDDLDYGLATDGKGPYVDDQDRVSAELGTVARVSVYCRVV